MAGAGSGALCGPGGGITEAEKFLELELVAVLCLTGVPFCLSVGREE